VPGVLVECVAVEVLPLCHAAVNTSLPPLKSCRYGQQPSCREGSPVAASRADE